MYMTQYSNTATHRLFVTSSIKYKPQNLLERNISIVLPDMIWDFEPKNTQKLKYRSLYSKTYSYSYFYGNIKTFICRLFFISYKCCLYIFKFGAIEKYSQRRIFWSTKNFPFVIKFFLPSKKSQKSLSPLIHSSAHP